jgi:hypothetical protein
VRVNHDVEIAGMAIRQRLDQNPVDHRVDDRDHAEADGQRARGEHHEQRGARQSADGELGVASPVAAAPPRHRRPHPFAGAVAE